MDPFIAQVMIFAGNFAPRGWALCEGQLLPIAQFTLLFSLVGTTYGGDGRTTFGLPDLRGRAPIGVGHGPGLSDYRWGQKGGSENTTLTTNNLPAHNHAINAEVGVSTGNGTTDEPDGNVLAGTSGPTYAAAASANGKLGGVSARAASTGGGQSINNMQPYLAMYYIIALEGIFPSRS